MKTLGLMTSGGDAPGMNAAIRTAARIAVEAIDKIRDTADAH